MGEKKGAGPLLPPQAPALPQRNRHLRKILVAISVVLYSAYIWRCTQAIPKLRNQIYSTTGAQCLQVEVLVPEKNGELWESLSATFRTKDFEAEAVNWLGGAVRVKTESYDDMGPVGEDPRWDAFGSFHEYLESVFPLVHKTLELTKVNTYGLLYVWQGADASLKPIVLAAHQDVVPVNPATADEWTHPPYSGHFDGAKVWGRGSSDDKGGLIGVLSSVESLIQAGFQPARSVVLAFGFDEEISGRQGAQKIVRVLLEKYGKNGVALVVDEGGGSGFAEVHGSVFAMPGIAEKGYLDVHVEVNAPGGHSSVPPKHTSIGILSALLVEYENNPYTVELTKQDPLYSTLQCFGQHAKDLSEDFRRTIRRSSSSKKELHKLEKAVFKDPTYKALVGTTQAIDVIQGGVKSNALPERAFAVVNRRISVTSSTDEVMAHDAKLLEKLAQKFNLTYSAFGTKYSQEADGAPSSGSLTLSDGYGTALAPAPVTPMVGKDAAPYQLLAASIKATYNSHRGLNETNEIIIVKADFPPLGLDTRYYWDLTRHIFRYNHSNAGKKTNRMAGIHTVNEAIEIDAFVEMIRFFTTLILNADETTTF
ncbi:hypothetical protein H0H81_007206 [Sphagnurus paluster]|uniref:Peptidase M20 dimerisation domain-containing protein n=1 Tax=Sphagnurus paluster TaxID=117069 RepID=A0A9P7K6C6_9AGAR|nr:hypothetical protein H0H81_007206 [Sphagnurus paluster]